MSDLAFLAVLICSIVLLVKYIALEKKFKRLVSGALEIKSELILLKRVHFTSAIVMKAFLKNLENHNDIEVKKAKHYFCNIQIMVLKELNHICTCKCDSCAELKITLNAPDALKVLEDENTDIEIQIV